MKGTAKFKFITLRVIVSVAEGGLELKAPMSFRLKLLITGPDIRMLKQRGRTNLVG